MCYSTAVGSKFVGHLHSKNLTEPSDNILLSSLDGSPLLAILLFAFHSKYIQEEIHADLVLLRFSMRFIKGAFELLHFYLRFLYAFLKYHMFQLNGEQPLRCTFQRRFLLTGTIALLNVEKKFLSLIPRHFEVHIIHKNRLINLSIHKDVGVRIVDCATVYVWFGIN